jgi:hypothetical protein
MTPAIIRMHRRADIASVVDDRAPSALSAAGPVPFRPAPLT